jgi:molecular chaperone GrpE
MSPAKKDTQRIEPRLVSPDPAPPARPIQQQPFHQPVEPEREELPPQRPPAADLAAQLAQAEADGATLRDQLRRLQAASAMLKQQLGQAHADAAGLKEQLLRAQASAAGQVNQLRQAQDESSAARSQLQRVQADAFALRESQEKVAADAAKLAKQLEIAEREIAGLKERLERSDAEAAARRQQPDLTDELARTQAELAALREELMQAENDPDPIDPSEPNASLAEELAKAQAELAAAKDQLLRALAEAENTRRRTQRDREEFARYAASPFAKDILPVADNLSRALAAVPPEALAKDEALKNLVDGIAATERQLQAALERHHIKRIEALGEKFDSHRHQAMFEMPGSGKPGGTVVQELQAGYLLHDRLLRPALVGVAKGEPAATEPANDEAAS